MYPTLPYPTLFYPIHMTYLIYPTLSIYVPHPTPSYTILPHPTLSYVILRYPTLSYAILRYPTPALRGSIIFNQDLLAFKIVSLVCYQSKYIYTFIITCIKSMFTGIPELLFTCSRSIANACMCQSSTLKHII